ncbi:MAG: RloB family protein [Clostridiales bacterium]|nr:RloB family protein [Clostridiales bacterium]
MGNGRWLIVCEGTKTEPGYFSGLLEYFYNKGGRDLSPFVEIYGVGRATESLVRSAENFFEVVETEYGRQKAPHSNVAAVFDRDVFGKDSFNHAIKLADLQRRKYPEMERYIAAWSNESFELWIYLHFHFTDSAIGRHGLNAKLTEIFRAGGALEGRRTYSSGVKTREGIFRKIMDCGGSLEAAVRNAKRLSEMWADGTKYADQNPRTEVWRLVVALAEEAGVTIAKEV